MSSRLSQVEYNKRRNKFLLGFHWCTKCKQFLPLEKFNKYSQGMFGYRIHCISCRRKFNKENAKRHNPKQRQYNRQLKAYYKKLFGGKCAKCGYSKTQLALDFHHVHPEDKEYQPSVIINTNKHLQIMIELNKCILLCQNCHSEFEANCWDADFIKIGTLGYRIKPGSIIENKKEFWIKPSNRILYSQQVLFETDMSKY